MMYSYKKWHNSNNNTTETQTCIVGTDFSVHICSLSFAVLVQALKSLIYTSSSHSPIPSSWQLADAFPTL